MSRRPVSITTIAQVCRLRHCTLLVLLLVQVLLLCRESIDGADRDRNVKEGELAKERLEALLFGLPIDLRQRDQAEQGQLIDGHSY